MEIKFSKEISFPDGDIEEIDFEATFIKSGIGNFEFWGQKGYESHWELDEIVCMSELDNKQLRHIDEIIDNGNLGDLAYQTFENERYSQT